MPIVSSDYRQFSVRIRPGIYFADDPAFKGQRRELTAADFVYSIKRFCRPANKAQAWTQIEDLGLAGLNELHRRVIERKQPFPMTSRWRASMPPTATPCRCRPSSPGRGLIESLFTGNDLLGAVAREVVETYGDQISAHPVGTGPFKLVEWPQLADGVRAHPGYRERYYDAQPPADDAQGQAWLARFKGRRSSHGAIAS